MTTTAEGPRVYTVAEVAAILKVREQTVYKMVRERVLASFEVRKGDIRITAQELDRYLGQPRP